MFPRQMKRIRTRARLEKLAPVWLGEAV